MTRTDQAAAPVAPVVLAAATWRVRAAAHAERADALTAGHRDRRSRGERHPVEDFLFEYYPARPSHLRRWHPGAGVALAPDGDPVPQTAWRWYRTDPSGTVVLDRDAFLADRGDTVRYVRDLLAATAARPAATGCFGLHEWAMVYREPEGEHRHPLPLRLGPRARTPSSRRIASGARTSTRSGSSPPRPCRATSTGPPGRRRSPWSSRGACTRTWTATSGRSSSARWCPVSCC